MFNQHCNSQELAYSPSENSNNEKQQKMKPLTAFVQVEVHGPANGQEVKLSQDCSTVAEHAAFLLGKINKSQGSVVGLQLNVPVELATVLEGTVALMELKVPLEANYKYTFRFKLANVPKEEVGEGPDLVADLAMEMAHLAMEKEELKKQIEGQAGKVVKLVEEQAKNMAQLKGEQAKQQGQLQKLEKDKEALNKRVKELKKLVEGPSTAKLILLGLDNSGKTTLLHLLKGDVFSPHLATLHTTTDQLSLFGTECTVFDVSGHVRARRDWKSSFSALDTVVFLVDVADLVRIQEAKEELWTLLQDEKVATAPVLILGNKSDEPNALSEDYLKYELGIQEYCTGKDCASRSDLATRPLELFMCSLLCQQGYEEAFCWLSQYLD